MLWVKSCPRCHGDVYNGGDMYGPFVACVQCGYYLTEAEEILLRYPRRVQAPASAPVHAAKALVAAAS